MTIFYEKPFIETFQNKVKAADHFGGKVDELIVKFPVVFLKMGSLYFEYIFLE